MPAASELLVGVDIATAEVRAVAVDADGLSHAAARAALPPPTSPRPGWCEQDARAWWPAVAAATAEVTQRLGTARRGVRAVAVSATSGTVVALDATGAPLGPALLYSDQRATQEAEAAQAAGATRWASLGLCVQPSFGLPKWAWLLRQPETAAAVARLAHVSDVVVAHLTGAPAPSDWSHALKSGFDPQRGEWASEALAALGIPPRLLPEVRRPTTTAGRVSREAAAATGLPRGCEVRLGMTDSCAAQLAAGASAPGRFVSVLGSTLVLKGASRALVADPAGAVYSHRHPDGWWLPGGASSTGGAALRAAFPGADLAALDDFAARRGPARAVIYPLLGQGERFPFAAPGAEGFTLGAAADEVERYRATLEGVAFVERLGYERLARLGAVSQPPVAVTGGGSRSATWNRIRASVLGMALTAAPAASTALGACILAAAGSVHPDLTAAAEAMAASGRVVAPDEAQRDALDRSYRRFVAAVEERGWLPCPAPRSPAPRRRPQH